MIRIFSANWIITGTSAPLQNGAVVLKGDRVFDLGPRSEIEGKYSNRIYDLGNTIVFPAFVNAHTHLELTHLRGNYDIDGGFLQWMRSTSDGMQKSEDEEIKQGVSKGIESILESGTIGIGDTTATSLTAGLIQDSRLYARIFHEVKGFRNFKIPYLMQKTEKRLKQFQDSERVTHHLAPHSPFLVGRKLFQEIEQRESLISLHLASVPEEIEFFETGQGPIKQMLLAHEMFDYKWEIPKSSPVKYFFENYYYAQSNILVHMIHVSEADMDYMAESHVDVHICLCPRSHSNLNLGVAPARKYRKRGFNLCLGTDNVVVSGDFDMREEMKAAAEEYQFSPQQIFEMGTSGGARALGFEDQLGTIEPGKCGHILVMENPFGVDKDPYEAILESDRAFRWIHEVDVGESTVA